MLGQTDGGTAACGPSGEKLPRLPYQEIRARGREMRAKLKAAGIVPWCTRARHTRCQRRIDGVAGADGAAWRNPTRRLIVAPVASLATMLERAFRPCADLPASLLCGPGGPRPVTRLGNQLEFQRAALRGRGTLRHVLRRPGSDTGSNPRRDCVCRTGLADCCDELLETTLGAGVACRRPERPSVQSLATVPTGRYSARNPGMCRP